MKRARNNAWRRVEGAPPCCLKGTGVFSHNDFATQLVFFLTRSHISYWLASSCICSGPAMDLELNGMEDLEFLGYMFEDFEVYK